MYVDATIDTIRLVVEFVWCVLLFGCFILFCLLFIGLNCFCLFWVVLVAVVVLLLLVCCWR